ncbi:peroxidase family protein [Microbacterium sp.]|uniref:peroxidase family protein n=1 Tax=Microbacterium sp. TaxID=51671 RepID=UPI0039E6FC6D
MTADENPAEPDAPFAAQPFLREQLHLAEPGAAERVAPGVRPLRRRDAVPEGVRRDLVPDAGRLRVARRFGTQDVIQALPRLSENAVSVQDLPLDIRESLKAVRPEIGRFHGAKFSLGYFPSHDVFSRCADRFGYLTSSAVRTASKLPIDTATRALLAELGHLMGNSGRETAPDSATPAGYTYVGQFVDHDITLDVSSALDSAVEIDAQVINNMRSPSLDLDSVYGKGPALDAFLYASPEPGEPDTAFRLLLGTNTPAGPGGPGGAAGFAGMVAQTDFDVPRTSAQTAIIGDPRNNENLIVSQLHHAMLRFHNAIVDLLVLGGFTGDVFVEAKRQTTLHYQWAVLHDYLPRVCGQAAVDAAVAGVSAAVGSAFRMPVEFSVGAYRFGHSMVRDAYWLNFNFPNQPMSDVFAFVRPPRLPVLSNWVVDFNAFFDTGIPVPVHNKARKIDSVLATALEDLDGNGLGALMSVLATRNLLRGLVLGLPSGQAAAQALGVPVLTAAELTAGLPADEVAVLNKQGGLLLSRTPLWYYVLREAMVTANGEHLGPLGGKIVADTFLRMLRRDGESILNVAFAPSLPRADAATFTFADIVDVAGVTVP